MRPRTAVSALLVAVASTTAIAAARQPRASVDWPAYGNDAGGQKYSPLADINRDNVSRLDTLFTWSANEQNIPAGEGQKPARAGQFQATPLAIHDTLFFSTSYNRVIALDASTGREFVVVRPAGVEDVRAAEQRHRVRAPRRGDVDQRARTARVHQLALAAHCARRGHRQADSVLRHERGDRPHREPVARRAEGALHQHVAAGGVGRHRHARQRRRRPAGLSRRSAGRHPGVRRAHRQAPVALQDRAGTG